MFLGPLLSHSPSPKPKSISCLDPNFAGRWIVTTGLLPVKPFSPGMSLQCVPLMWLSRSIQRHRPHLDKSLTMPAVHSHFVYHCGSSNIIHQPRKATYFSDKSSQFHILPMCMFFHGVWSRILSFFFARYFICFAAALSEMGRSCVSVTLMLPRGQYMQWGLLVWHGGCMTMLALRGHSAPHGVSLTGKD